VRCLVKVWDWLIRRRLPVPVAPVRLRLSGAYLEGARYQASPNCGEPFNTPPHLIVMHYTSGASLQSSADFLCDENTRASAHVVIGRDGDIVQLVPLDQAAWHADPAYWDGYCMVNRHSIGVELDNVGELQIEDGQARTWWGRRVAWDDAVYRTHQYSEIGSWWQTFTPEQMTKMGELCRLLMGLHPIREIVGHDDVAPTRKRDPGPAFPMADLRARLGLQKGVA